MSEEQKKRAGVTIQKEIGSVIFEGEFESEPKVIWLEDKSGVHIQGDGVTEGLAEELRSFGLLVTEISQWDIFVEPLNSLTFGGDEKENESRIWLTDQKHTGEEKIYVLLHVYPDEWKIVLTDSPLTQEK